MSASTAVKQGMAIRRGVTAAMLLAQAAAAGAADMKTALSACRAEPAEEARLACYDAIVIADAATAAPLASWHGRNGTDSFAFTASAGDRLVISHDDVVLVGALKDAAGHLLENLHQAGRGSFTVPFRAAGDYQLSLSATGSWTARLEAGH